tara:strand:- start:4 stop:546 length:543 start_codon:yes stop_codon:yes gene_type:complete
MTVRITKPEFNLRDKLNYLDFDRVPYDKMPAGSIIQTNYTRFDYSGTQNEFETTSSTYQASPFLVKISPKFSSSIIKIQAAVNIKQNTGSNYIGVALFKSVNGGSFSNFTGGTTGHGLITYRISGGSTAWDHVNFMVYDTPNTTSSIIYKLYLRSNDNSQNVRIGENGAEEFMSAMEVRQ